MSHFSLLLLALLHAIVFCSFINADADVYPLIIAHRGASGYIPEHSLQAYQLAIDLHSNYIETDLCMTKDSILVALHDVLLDDVTNIDSLPEYADRKTTKVVDGTSYTGYFVSDFTYAELSSNVRLIQRLTYRSTVYNDYFTIPTLVDIINLVNENKENNAVVESSLYGLYAELKHPSYFNSLGMSMEDTFLSTLQANGYDLTNINNKDNKKSKLIIECFDSKSLIYMRSKTTFPLVYLLEAPSAADEVTFLNTTFLTEVSAYANGIGPEKSFFFDEDYSSMVTSIIDTIHSMYMFIHPYTYREDSGINKRFNNDFQYEIFYSYCCLHMDGIFIEQPDEARQVLASTDNCKTEYNDYTCSV